MLKTILIILTAIMAVSTFAQVSVKGKVLTPDERPIPFATLLMRDGTGMVCDASGGFSFDLERLHHPELVVSALGYVSDTVVVDTYDEMFICHLHKNNYAIAEVSVHGIQKIEYKSSVSALTVGKKAITKLNPQSVGQLLQNQVGFTIRTGYQTPLTLRGMSGRRLLVLRNGNRRFSSYTAGVMTHTINVYDLERIEVEKGASSVVYGSSAMAGIINLIDKSPFKQEGFDARFTAGYGSVNREQNFLACGGWSNGKLAFKASARYRDADNFYYADGTEAENSFYTDKDLFVTGGYQFSDRQELVFTVDWHDGGPWGKPVGFNGSNYMRVGTDDEQSTNIALNYRLSPSNKFSELECSFYYSDEARSLIKRYYTAAGYMLSYVETTHFSDYYYGNRTTACFNISDKYHLTCGVEGYHFNISTPTDAIDYIEAIVFQNRVSQNARSYTFGAFADNRYQFSETILLKAGIRYNMAKVYQGDVFSTKQEQELHAKRNAFSGNLASHIDLQPNMKLKLNVARSFRMPETTELYTDSYTSNGILYGNPELTPEYCNSFDVSYRFHNRHFDIELSPFLWCIDNMITKEILNGMPGTNYTYVNIGKTRVFGGELNAKYIHTKLFSPEDKLMLRSGLSYLNGTDISEGSFFSEGIPLDFVPPINIKSELSYATALGQKVMGNAALRSIYYAEQTRLGEITYATPSYHVLGVNCGLQFKKMKTTPSLNITVNNVFNKTYYSYQTYLPSEGRDVRLFLTLNL